MSRRSQVLWTLIILASLAFQWFVAVLGAGYRALHGVADSAGNPIGFNDPVTNEHIRMMFAQVSVGAVFAEAGWYFSLCLLAHLGGLSMIWLANRQPKRPAAYFGFQTVLFPLGWIPIFWFTPFLALIDLFAGFDGETLTDAPLNLFGTHSLWWIISLVVAIHGLALADRQRGGGPAWLPQGTAH